MNAPSFAVRSQFNTWSGVLLFFVFPLVFPLPAGAAWQSLTVGTSGGGIGGVTSSPADGSFNCSSVTLDSSTGAVTSPTACKRIFNSSKTVTLTASPAAGSAFAGWKVSGCNTPALSCTVELSSCSGTGTCVVTVDSEKWVTAFFNKTSSARIFYVDYQSGSNSNSGTKEQPWKTHPYMNYQGAPIWGPVWSGTGYSHVAGDRFIFKGGVTWPSANGDVGKMSINAAVSARTDWLCYAHLQKSATGLT